LASSGSVGRLLAKIRQNARSIPSKCAPEQARLKKRLVLEAIAREEKLQVEPAEVEAELERLREVMTSKPTR
jgi:FKBP-type peptidyl-prolyl cis-trans isomerase (trigger factor)